MKYKVLLFILVLIPPVLLAFMQSMPESTISTGAIETTLPEHPKALSDQAPIQAHHTALNAPPAAKITPSNAHSETTSGIERLKAMTNTTSLQAAVLQDYDQYQRYPPNNARIESAQQDPISHRYAIDQRTTMNEDHSLGLTVWTNQKFYIAGDTINIHALIENAEGEKLASSLDSTVIFQHATINQPLNFARQQDGSYLATIRLDQGTAQASSNKPVTSMLKQPGIYKVLIVSPQHELQDAVTFTLSQPDIVLTGEYKDTINDQGDLVIEAEVETFSHQRFYIQASLYSSTQLPVGSTQFSQTLTQGKHWIPLSFAGRLIHDSEESGPYILKQVSLAKVTMPMQRAPVIMPEYQTDAYALAEFSERNYGDRDQAALSQ